MKTPLKFAGHNYRVTLLVGNGVKPGRTFLAKSCRGACHKAAKYWGSDGLIGRDGSKWKHTGDLKNGRHAYSQGEYSYQFQAVKLLP